MVGLTTINTGDTAFVLICAALVALMTPGLAFFYGGLVRRKNFLAIMMQIVHLDGRRHHDLGVLRLLARLLGRRRAASSANLNWAVLTGVGAPPGPWAPNIPAQAHFVYQEMFAIITPALITGAFADRVKFKSYLIFLVVWSILVYIPFVHWIWGGGWLVAARRARLRRRHRRPRERRLRRPRLGLRRRQAQVRPGRARPAAQRGLRGPRHRPPLVRLVRLQRRLRARPPTASPPRRSSTPTSPARSPCAPGSRSPGAHDGKPSLVGALTGAVAGLACVTPAPATSRRGRRSSSACWRARSATPPSSS